TSHEEEVLGWNNQRHPNKHIAYLCLVPNLCSTRHTHTHTHKHTHTYTQTHTHTYTHTQTTQGLWISLHVYSVLITHTTKGLWSDHNNGLTSTNGLIYIDTHTHTHV